MTTNKSTDSGISQRTTLWAAKEMLKHAAPTIVLNKMGTPVRMPKNKSLTVKFRRPDTFAAATTPLVEGTTPTGTAFSYTDVSVSLKQYGQLVVVTDVIEDTHEDPVLQDATLQLGENLGRTQEALAYAVLKAGTSVTYNNGSARNAVNTAITLNKQRAVTRALKAQKAKKITRILSGSVNYATTPVEAAYVAVAHTDTEADIRNLAGFTPVAKYGTMKPICDEEIGMVEDVRYVLSADLDSWADAGGAKGTMYSTTGTSADVYPILFFGMDAFAHVAIKGKGAVDPSIISADQKTKDDPLGQRGYAGWKTYYACGITNQAWMMRLEVAITAL